MVARNNPLIVLQTDFGAKSPYMGALMGAIYRTNPYARIQVNTCEIDPFDVTLKREIIQPKSVSYRAEGDFGYVRLASFTEKATSDLRPLGRPGC